MSNVNDLVGTLGQYYSANTRTKSSDRKSTEAGPVPMATSTTTPEEQARLLEDALAVVRQQTILMRRCLETPGKLMDALKCR